jgi:hypothetical protein
MYETPKACHFRALLDGRSFNERDPVGLEFRWCAASRVKEVIDSMLPMTEHKRELIQVALNPFNVTWERRGIRVELRV